MGIFRLPGLKERGRQISASFDPMMLPDLEAWYALRKMGLADDASIASFTDFSGSGRAASQSTPTSRPTNKVNVINGHPVARFDGGDWLTAGTGWNYSAYTVFVVVRFANAIDDNLDRNGVFAIASGVNDRMFLMSGGFSASDRLYGALNQAVGGEISGYSTNIAAGTPLILCLQSAPAGTQLFVNGVAQALSNNDASPPLTAAAELRLGARYGTSFTDLLVGDEAEFLLYSRFLPTVERRRVEKYLSAVYAVPV